MRLLVGGGDPEQVRVEEEEENHAYGHEVHVDEKQDATVIEAPAGAHAANGVDGAGEGEDGWEGDECVGAIVGEVRETDGCAKAEEDKYAAAQERRDARVEDAGYHAALPTCSRIGVRQIWRYLRF
jgi:hypothetical protein